MAETPAGGFDLDRAIPTRLDGDIEPGADTHLQALAVLIDADLTDTERAHAFARLMATLLATLSAQDSERFRQIGEQDGEVAAMSYLSAIARLANEVDRG